jgi:hypothetical protein
VGRGAPPSIGHRGPWLETSSRSRSDAPTVADRCVMMRATGSISLVTMFIGRRDRAGWRPEGWNPCVERRPGTQWVPEVSKRAVPYGLRWLLDAPLSRDFGRQERSPHDGGTAMVRKGSPVRVRQRASEAGLLRGFSVFGAAPMTISRHEEGSSVAAGVAPACVWGHRGRATRHIPLARSTASRSAGYSAGNARFGRGARAASRWGRPRSGRFSRPARLAESRGVPGGSGCRALPVVPARCSGLPVDERLAVPAAVRAAIAVEGVGLGAAVERRRRRRWRCRSSSGRRRRCPRRRRRRRRRRGRCPRGRLRRP